MTSADLPPLTVGPVDVHTEDFERWVRALRLVFKDHAAPTPSFLESRRKLYARQRVLAARDGDRIVGTFRSWDTTLTVPGGSLVADAISSVTVLPTHRRRGALTGMMTADLASAVSRRIPVAVLIASEAPIYGRYGFGVATDAVTWTLDVRAAAVRPEALRLAESMRLEPVTDAELRPLGPSLFERARRPGAIDFDSSWWDVICRLVEGPGWQRDPEVTILARDATGTVQGVLRYSAKETWEDRVINTRVDVRMLYAATPAAEAALWRYLVELDLVATVKAEDRPVDEPLPWLLRDSRAARQTSRCDFLWSRVLDPAAALGGRRYAVPGAVVLEITDPQGWAAGKIALEADSDGKATCEPTAASPDVTMAVDVLSEVWLGGGDLVAAMRAGRVAEHRDGMLERTAALFRTPRAPWCPTWF